jgi:hypothetical protein
VVAAVVAPVSPLVEAAVAAEPAVLADTLADVGNI